VSAIPAPRTWLDPLIAEARRRARRRRGALAACLLAAGAAGFFGFMRGGGNAQPSARARPPRTPTGLAPPHTNGPLTVIGGKGISAIGSDGALRPVFPCASDHGCYDLQSVDWSPDGNLLAFSVTTIGAVSSYNGIHVVHPATGRDTQISTHDGFSLDWSPDGSKLAYVSSYSFPSPWGQIVIVDADGSHAHVLATGTQGADMSPSWSPDGTRIAFETVSTPDADVGVHRTSVVSVIDVDGRHRAVVARDASGPAWSPDGTKIAYHARCGGIKLVTPAGRDVTPASEALECRSFGPRGGVPVWSPDGRFLATANRHGVFVVSALGGNAHPRLRTGFGAADTGLGIFRTARPTWQPVTSLSKSARPSAAAMPNARIVFTRYRLQDNPLQAEIFSTGLEGGAARRVETAPTAYVDGEPDVAANGASVVFQRCPPHERGGCQIWSAPLPSGKPHRLTAPSARGSTPPKCLDESSPAYSADARAIAFECNGGPTTFAIVAMDARGNHRRVVVRGTPAFGVGRPQFSPDGKWLAFERQNITAKPKNGHATYVMRLNGSGLRRVTPWQLAAGDHPEWSPDGRRLLVRSLANGPDFFHQGNLYTVGIDGRGLRQLTHFAASVRVLQNGSFSTDGRSIVFATTAGAARTARSDLPDLFVMSATGGRARPVTPAPNWDGSPDWR
jgi:TolB protein